MMDLMTVGIFSGCFVVVLSLVWLLSFLTKEQSYEDGLRLQRQQKGGSRLAALGVNKASAAAKEDKPGKKPKDKQDKTAKAKKAQQRRDLFGELQSNADQPDKPSKKAKKRLAKKAAEAAAAAVAAAAVSTAAETAEEEAVVSNDEAAAAAATEVETIEVSSSESELEGVLGNSAEQTPLVAVEVQQPAAPEVAEQPQPVEPVVEEPVEANVVHLTAAGKAKANKKQDQASKSKMTIEEVDACTVMSNKPEQPATVEIVERVPVVEPLIVKEEATLLYEDKMQQGSVGSTGNSGTATPSQQASTPVSGNRQNKKKQRGGGGGNANNQNQQLPVQPQDLMTAVRKTNFDDEELQNLIDILLNKQQNSPGTAVNGSWVDPQTNEMKQLQRSLADREMQLEVEQARVKDMNNRYQAIQRELGESKNQNQRLRNDFQGQINGLQREKMEAEQSFANVSHRQSYDIQNLNHQNQELVRQINELNGHLAVYRTRPGPEDVKAELEQAHSNELNNLHSQLSHRTNELASVKQQVQELRSKMEGSEGAKDAMSMELSKAKEQTKSLEKKVTMLQQNNQMLSESQSQEHNTKTAELQSRIEELSQSKAGLEASLGEVTSSLKAATDQLGSARADLEAKAAAWEEEKKALVSEQVQVNGKKSEEEEAETDANHKRQEEEFVAKLNQVLKEKEALVQKISTDQQQLQSKVSEADSLRTELESVKGQLKDASVSLDQQRAKNDDDKSSIVKQTEEKYVTFLARLFDGVDFGSDESAWKGAVEAQIQAMKDSSSNKATEVEDNSSSSEEIEKLEKQVNHYKSSLQETETLLHKLQASVEAEEAKWKASLSDQQKELDALKEQNAKMESCVQSAEEMQEKLQQLQSQLIGHEAAKRDLEKTLAEKSDSESEEKQKLIQEIESLKEGKAELGLQVARMNQLVTAGQEALQQEQKTADLLREQLAKVKDTPDSKSADNSTNNEDGNGTSSLLLTTSKDTAKAPPHLACTTAKTPTLGSVASLDLSMTSDHQNVSPSPTTSDDKKKKKKKLLGLIKINK